MSDRDMPSVNEKIRNIRRNFANDTSLAEDLREIAGVIESHDPRPTRDVSYDKLRALGKSLAVSFAGMASAVGCDYARLDELRADRMNNPGHITIEAWMASDKGRELDRLEQAAGDYQSRDDAAADLLAYCRCLYFGG